MRPLTAALTVFAFGLALAVRGGGPTRASACSFGLFNYLDMDQSLSYATVIAVGTLSDPQGNAITLTVEIGLKGAAAGSTLTVNNSLNLDCYESVVRERRNYEPGTRVLALLVPDTYGVAEYKPARFGYDARIGRINAIDIGIDLALVRLERRRQRHARGIRAAAA